MTLKDLWELLQETWNAWSTHRAPRSGAALAYYTIFSLAPLLVIVIAVAALVFLFGAEFAAVYAQSRGSRATRKWPLASDVGGK
jgi:membrane protein